MIVCKNTLFESYRVFLQQFVTFLCVSMGVFMCIDGCLTLVCDVFMYEIPVFRCVSWLFDRFAV